MQKVIPIKSKLIPDNARKVFTGQIFDVYQWDQEMYDGSTKVFEMLKRPDTVTTLGVVDGKILLVEDEQPDRGMWQTLPGGRCDDTDKSALEAAQREMKEETGYTFKNWRLIRSKQPAAKIEQFIYTFLAWDVESLGAQVLDVGEKIRVKFVSLEELKKIAEAGTEPHIEYLSTFLDKVDTIDALLALPAFEGQEVDR